MDFFLQIMVNSIAIGSIYALIGLGFVIIYKASDVLNFAQGEFVMVGAFISFYLLTTFKIPFWLAILITAPAVALLGIFTEILVLRRMIGEPIFAVVMITIGLSEVLRNLMGIVCGPTDYVYPTIFSQSRVTIMKNVFLLPAQIWIIISAWLLVIVLLLFFNKTRVGLGMRTAASDQDVALLMGVSVKRVFSISWGIASAVGAISGVLLGNLTTVNIHMGHVGLVVFPAIILGGLDSIGGAIVGGIVMGVVEAFSGGYLDKALGGGIKEITAFVVLIGILMIKPHGLFGKPEIERV